MTSQLTIRGWVYSVVAVVGPFVALALADPAPALLALPAAAFTVFGLVARPKVDPAVEVTVEPGRTVEGEPVRLDLKVEGDGRAAHVLLELAPELEPGKIVGGSRAGSGLVVPLGGGFGAASVEVTPRRWGTYQVGAAAVTVPGPMGIVTASSHQPSTEHLVVLPETEKIRRLVEPLATNLHAGDVVSTARGPGTDLAEMRLWTPVDSPRSISWRTTARSDLLWVTDRHLDRKGDLILVIDSILPPGGEMEEAVTRAVRIAASLVRAYGAARHRLGLLSLGGYHRWFGLDSGALHEHRLLAAVMATQSLSAPVWAAVDRVLERVVHPPSMVAFVSPLIDDELQGRVLRLAGAGIDVIVVAVDLSPWIRQSHDRIPRLARRIWQMERERHLERLRASGIAVGEWRIGRPLEELVEEIEAWRRRWRRARV